MNINYWDLGQQGKGSLVEFKLTGTSANVRLLDWSNFRAFRSGRRYQGVGGNTNRSPVRLQIPQTGHWYAVIDYGGYAGRGSAGVRVLS